MSEVQEIRKPNRFRVTSIIIAIVMLAGAFGVLISPFTINGSATTTDVWNQTSGNLASTDANWLDGTKPTGGEDVIFNGTSTASCTWDLPVALASFSMNSGYTGTITVSANTNWSTTGNIATIAGSTFTGATTSWVTCAGSASFAGTLTTDSLQLQMSGANKSLTALTTTAYSLRFSGITTVTCVGSVSHSLIIDSGATLILSNSLYAYAGYGWYMTTISNLGLITGTSSLVFSAHGTNQTLTGLGVISASVIMKLDAGASTIYTLGEDTTGMTGALAIYSDDSVNTLTLNTGNYNLSAGDITIGIRGIINGTGSTINCNGNWDSGIGQFLPNTSTLKMNGVGKTIVALSVSAYILRISGSTTLSVTCSATHSLIVDSGAILIISAGKSMDLYAGYWGLLTTISNLGTIAGTGVLVFTAYHSNQILTGLGIISAPVEMKTTGGASTTYTLGEDTTGMTGSLAIYSSDGTYTLTLDTDNYSLSAGEIIIGTRGILNGRASMITCGGNWDSTLGTFIAGTSVVVMDDTNSAWLDFLGSLSFTREPTNPLLVHDTVWEGTELADYQIVEDSTELKMYYSGLGGIPDGFGLATSPKVYPPTVWTKQGQIFGPNPIPGQWDSYRVRLGTVLKVDSTYYMYYMGLNGSLGGELHIGLATSINGIDWTRQGIVIHDGYCDTPAVIHMSGTTWLMYYSHRHSVYDCEVKLATSSNGLSWAQVGTVLNTGIVGQWDSTYIEHININYIGGHYVILYEAYNGTVINWTEQLGDGTWQLGIAYSTTPASGFVKYSGNPIFSHSEIPGSFDEHQVDTPIFFYHENGTIGTYYLFYGGNPNVNWTTSDWNMGLAYSEDITTFKTIKSNTTMKVSTGNSICLAFVPQIGQDVTLANLSLGSSQIYWTSTSTDTVTFTLSGLESGRMYRLYIDGISSSLLTASGSGVVSFTYSGPWSEHQFEVVGTSITGSISPLVNLIFIMFAIGIVVGVVAESTYSIRKMQIRSTQEMVKSLVNMVIYIIIGIASLGVLYSIVA